MYPIINKLGWTPREGGGQHHTVVLRDQVDSSLMDSTRTSNSYLTMTSIKYFMKESF